MADTIADLTASLSNFKNKLDVATQNRASNIQEINTLSDQLTNLNSQRQGLSVNSPEYKALMTEMSVIQTKLEASRSTGTQYANQLAQYQSDVLTTQERLDQLQKDQTAAASTPTGATSTPPQSVSNTSNPITVTSPTVIPVISEIAPPTTYVGDSTTDAPLITVANEATAPIPISGDASLNAAMTAINEDIKVQNQKDPDITTDNTDIPLEDVVANPPLVDAEFGDPAIFNQRATLGGQSMEEFRLNPPPVEPELISGDASLNAAMTQLSTDISGKSSSGLKVEAQTSATARDEVNFEQKQDWRVRLSLAPNANYLYKAKNVQGILNPLIATDGILFPYTPSITVNYAAHYDQYDVTHSNYKVFQYKNSSVEQLNITCDFTAQDTFEANYLLAVIHFFKSVTKMFYGQDSDPARGSPPPLCYLFGLGAFQFDAHPLVVTSFNYTLPTDVDYIRAGNTATAAGVNKSPSTSPNNTTNTSTDRLAGQNITAGGNAPPVSYQTTGSGTYEPTYVPTKMQIQIAALPIVSRNDISNRFSLKDYATGKLLQGTKQKRGGIW